MGPVRHTIKKADYGAELALLVETYGLVRDAVSSDLEALLERVDDGPALFVASGGAFAVAQFAADLHHHYTGHLARAVTPLEFCALRANGETAAVMFTASGRHPDAAMAMEAAKAALCRVIGVVTLRDRSRLPAALRGDRVQVVTVKSARERDGFLATNSVLAMATALVRARVGADGMPARLAMLERGVDVDVEDQCLALFPPRHAAVAYDLEARLHETGLAALQLADYRNFAHGRHAGLARNLASTTVVAFTSADHRGLAVRTLALLPKATELVTLDTVLSWPASVLDLLVASMKLIEAKAQRVSLNPARPGVAPFGRRLYHLSAKSEAARQLPLPVARKMLSIGRLGVESPTQATFEAEFERWKETLRCTAFGGLVLDYDGTCCTTEGRFELPLDDVQTELRRLLQRGLFLGFASGRGASLHRDLQKWVPPKFWDRIVLGLYNGALLLPLTDKIDDQSCCDVPLASARARLEASSFARLISVEAHTHQVEARLTSSRVWSVRALADAARELFEREPALPVKVVASAHSLDIVLAETTKRQVLDVIRSRCGGDVLAIGDQGQVGGNDFELLSAATTTLSVDRCSGDPTRCWNLDVDGHRGPSVLLRYLRALSVHRGTARFRWGKR